jgi:hypothetical protein
MLNALFALCMLGAASFAPVRIHALALLVAPPRPTEIEISPEPAAEVAEEPAQRSAIVDDEARPTLARPTAGTTGLFQGWGPRLGR